MHKTRHPIDFDVNLAYRLALVSNLLNCGIPSRATGATPGSG